MNERKAHITNAKHNKTESVTQVQHLSQTYSGPVPQPEDLAKYEQIQPGFADRLMTMAEIEQKEPIAATNTMLDNEKIRDDQEMQRLKTGQYFALLSVFTIASLLTYIAYLGAPQAAAAAKSIAIVGVVDAFVSGNLKKKNH